MNPLKAFYLQHDEQQELNATLGSTMGRDNMDDHRRYRCNSEIKCKGFVAKKTIFPLWLIASHSTSFSDSQSSNKVAERVLLRLQEKLKGVEEGTVLSVGGQVNLLIQQAMDPKNLSRLFHGWQAWV